MQYITYADINAKVRRALDLQDELFITSEEMLDYCNDGIDEIEAEVHTIYEDYFLSETTIDLVQGQSLYELPTGIYAMKIREIVYNDNSGTIYKMRRMQPYDRLEVQQFAERYSTTDWYKYYIINNTAADINDTPQIKLVPASQVDLTGGLIVHYLRNANRMTGDTSVCDIPEFAAVVMQYMKVRCYEKEGHPNLELAKVDLERLREKMRDTLSNMVPDGDSTIPLDLSFYEESF